MNHPFTAHLERKVAEEDLSEEPDSGFGVRLRIVLKITADSDKRIFFCFSVWSANWPGLQRK